MHFNNNFCFCFLLLYLKVLKYNIFILINFLSKTLQKYNFTLLHYFLKYNRNFLSIVTQCNVQYTSNISFKQQYMFYIVQNTKKTIYILLIEYKSN